MPRQSLRYTLRLALALIAGVAAAYATLHMTTSSPHHPAAAAADNDSDPGLTP
jgi:hypothetical protein